MDTVLNFPLFIFFPLKTHKTDILTLPTQQRSSNDHILPVISSQICQQFLMWESWETLQLMLLQFFPVRHIVHSWMSCSKWGLMTTGLYPWWPSHQVLSFSFRKPWEEKPPFLPAHTLLSFTPFSKEEFWCRGQTRASESLFCCMTFSYLLLNQAPVLAWPNFSHSPATLELLPTLLENSAMDMQPWPLVAQRVRWGKLRVPEQGSEGGNLLAQNQPGSSQEWLGKGWLLSSHCVLKGFRKGSWKGDSQKQRDRSRAQSFNGLIS